MAENDQVKWRGVRNVAGDAGIEVIQGTAADLKAQIEIAAAQSVQVTQATYANLKGTSQIRAYDYDNTTWRDVACDADGVLKSAGG